MEQKINIIGSAGDWAFEDVRTSVIKLGDGYDWRHSKEIIKIPTTRGLRYHRKKAELVERDDLGAYYLKADIVHTIDGVAVGKHSASIVTIDAGVQFKSFCILIDDKWYTEDDKRIVNVHGGGRSLLSNTVLLLGSVSGDARIAQNTRTVFI